MYDDIEWICQVQLCGLDVQIVRKPPQLPYLNVLDLGYFTSIQCLQQTNKSLTVNQLVSNVQQSFIELLSNKIINILLTLKSVVIDIIKNDGYNNYLMKHHKKE